MLEVPLVTVHQLALWLLRKDKIAVLDIRSYREYQTSHVFSAINLGGNRSFKRRLLANSHVLGPFISLLVKATIENLLSFKKIVLYDQCSADLPSVFSDNFTRLIISETADLFPNAVLLQGGFLGFRAAYPELCWQHPDKLPDEEFVSVKGDSGLENLLQECIFKLYHETPSTSLLSRERPCLSTRQLSSCSSCGSSSSQQSSDSDAVLIADLSADTALTIGRKAISRVTSAPINRPTTLVNPFSDNGDIVDDSCSRSLRWHPSTLSLCPASTPVDSSTCGEFSSLPLLSSPVPRPAPSPSIRPGYTVSTALSAEAFESPLPTAVLPHLLIGCQADAMSAKVCAEFGVTHIINVSADGETSPHVPASRFLRIPINDNGKANIVPYFKKAFALLDSAKRSDGRVLIHCFAGISRSPTLAIAYLMYDQRLTFDEAYNRVKSTRPKVSPNFNFIGQLTNFERDLNLSSQAQSPPPPVMIVPTVVPSLAKPSPAALRILHTTSVVTASSMTTPLPSMPVLSRPVTLSLRRPTLKPLIVEGSKKRDRSQCLSFHSSSSSGCSTSATELSAITSSTDVTTCTSSASTKATISVNFIGRRKRSRFGPLLPSPSTAIASLDLSSSLEKGHLSRLKSASPPPPPPSPRPRRLRHSSPLGVKETRRFSLSTFSEIQFAGATFAAVEAPSSDIDSEIDITDVSPTVIGVGLQSPNASAHRWILGESCRHQQATAESSCHSSLSSSSNSQHTPSLPIS